MKNVKGVKKELYKLPINLNKTFSEVNTFKNLLRGSKNLLLTFNTIGLFMVKISDAIVT